MMNKLLSLINNRYLSVVYIIVSLLFSGYMIHIDRAKRDEIKRLTSNQDALFGDLTRYATSDSLQAARVKTLTLTLSELKESNSALRSNISDLNVKLRDVKTATLLNQEAHYSVPVHDTTVIIHHDTITEAMPAVAYSDKWLSLLVSDGKADVHTRDSIVLVRHSRTKKILFWTIRKYSGEITVKNYNPYSTIDAITTVDITN